MKVWHLTKVQTDCTHTFKVQYSVHVLKLLSAAKTCRPLTDWKYVLFLVQCHSLYIIFNFSKFQECLWRPDNLECLMKEVMLFGMKSSRIQSDFQGLFVHGKLAKFTWKWKPLIAYIFFQDLTPHASSKTRIICKNSCRNKKMKIKNLNFYHTI